MITVSRSDQAFTLGAGRFLECVANFMALQREKPHIGEFWAHNTDWRTACKSPKLFCYSLSLSVCVRMSRQNKSQSRHFSPGHPHGYPPFVLHVAVPPHSKNQTQLHTKIGQVGVTWLTGSFSSWILRTIHISIQGLEIGRHTSCKRGQHIHTPMSIITNICADAVL